MGKQIFTFLLLFLIFSAGEAFSQNYHDDLKDRVRELEESNHKLEMKMQFLESHITTLENYMKLLVNNSRPEITNTEESYYTWSFENISERDFDNLKNFAEDYKTENFHYTTKTDLVGFFPVYKYTGEIGFFKTKKEAMQMRSSLPQNISLELKKLW